MTVLRIPQLWATSENYTSGPDIGTPTKVDPNSTLNGFIRGTAASAQHINYLLSQYASSAQRSIAAAALYLHPVALDGTAITDTGESMAAVSIGEGYLVVACKTSQALGVTDCGRFQAHGVPASITSLVNAAAYSPSLTRMLIVGTGGNRISYSDDGGANWSAGADLGGAPDTVVWNAAESRFIARQGTTARRSTNGAAAWSNSTISVSGDGGLAVLSSGRTVAAGYSAGPGVEFSLSDDGGATWSDAAGTISDAADSPEGGWVVGNEGSEVFHICRRTAGANSFRVSVSSDGSTWATLKDFAMPHAGATASRPKLLMCQNTGLLVAIMPVTPGAVATDTLAGLSASVDAGRTWTPIMYVAQAPINAFACAGGKLLFTRDAMLFASSGIGWQ
jgi:hypothetical protein